MFERSRLFLPFILATLAVSSPVRAEVQFDLDAADVDSSEASHPVPSVSPKPKTLKQLKAEIPKPGNREVKPEDFSQYPIVVDIFRASKQVPVLGAYHSSYIGSLTADSKEKNVHKRAQLARDRFASFAISDFAVVSKDGTPVKANLVSGAIETVQNDPVHDANGFDVLDPVTGEEKKVPALKTTPPGNYKLTPWNDSEGPNGRPNPFRYSSKFEFSTMYWALWIYEGFYIHQTPHYDQLGHPASKGCIRQSNPDARWLWDYVTNQAQGTPAMIRIHEMHSQEAYTRLRELFYDPNYVVPTAVPKGVPESTLDPGLDSEKIAGSSQIPLSWLVAQLYQNYRNLHTWMNRTGRGTYEGIGHGWYNPATKKFDTPVLPLCNGEDCVKVWGDPVKSIAKLAQKKRESTLKLRAKQVSRGIPIPRADSLALGLTVPVTNLPPAQN